MTMTLSGADAAAVTYVEGFEPGYLGRIAQMHGEYYAKAWGSGAGFEAMMAHELCEFQARYDPSADLLLTAHVDGVLVGSIAIDGTQSERPGMARVRWYLLDERYQGRGIGRELLERALAFCRTQGFPLVYLWTVEGLPQSLHLYQKAGFRIVERFVDSRYTVEHTQLRLEMPL
jgi:GNAT superfamily N-acetyltransferase